MKLLNRKSQGAWEKGEHIVLENIQPGNMAINICVLLQWLQLQTLLQASYLQLLQEQFFTTFIKGLHWEAFLHQFSGSLS
jgi:hypothetical protein